MVTRGKGLKITAYFIIIVISLIYLLQGIRTSSHLYNSKGWQFDITPSLIATKNLIQKGNSPYTKISQELIEKAYFGRETSQSDIINQSKHHFYYPLYAILFYIPLINLDISNALLLIWIFFYIIFLLTCWLWIRMIKLSKDETISVMLVSLFVLMPSTYYALQIRQPIFISFFFILLSYYLIMCGKKKISFIISGISLFLASIKPQISILAIGYILLILLPTMKSKKQNMEVWIGFMSVAILSLIITYILDPTWIIGFFNVVNVYNNTLGLNGSEILLGRNVLSYTFIIFISIIAALMIMINIKIKSRSLHFILFSYIMLMQPLVFTTNSNSIILVILVIALAVKQYYSLNYAKKTAIHNILIIFFILIGYMMVRRWLRLVSESHYGVYIVESAKFIVNNMISINFFVMLPISLTLAIILFYIEYRHEMTK
jgi:hypothetical protein